MGVELRKTSEPRETHGSRKDYLLKVTYIAVFAWVCLYAVTGLMLVQANHRWGAAYDDWIDATEVSGMVDAMVDARARVIVGERPGVSRFDDLPDGRNFLIVRNVIDIVNANREAGAMEHETERHRSWVNNTLAYLSPVPEYID